ncbi:MAG: hypothetical protein AAFQ45_06260 [Pseudomonadota bacterium]
MDRLETALISAHGSGDSNRLAVLYTEAADLAEDAGRIDAACFYLTHALVFALEAGAASATQLAGRLAAHNRMPAARN